MDSNNQRPQRREQPRSSAQQRSSAQTGKPASAQEPRTRKRKRKNTVEKVFGSTIAYIMMIIGVSLILATIGIVVANDMFALVKEDRTVMIELGEAKTPSQMAKILNENEIIKYKFWFSAFAKLKKVDKFSTGKFEVNSDMDYGQIIDTLIRVPTYREVVDVTIPEGYNLNQIAQLLEDTRVCGSSDFLEIANSYDFSHEVLKDVPMVDNRLEGYLFPDTYQFYVSDRPISVINKMLNNFENKFSAEMRKIASDKGMTIAQIVNIASLIEREAKIETDQTLISGVIHNRLNSDKYPFLEIDATILYATGHKEVLTAEDLKIDSPYNSRLRKGLPPTAICSPGIPAMLAAMTPDNHKYYFYVADPETGAHVFSKTLDEHNANVAKMNAKKKGS